MSEQYQNPIDNRGKKIEANIIHLTHIYMTARFPVLVQALQ
jgi:hypothetical protein